MALALREAAEVLGCRLELAGVVCNLMPRIPVRAQVLELIRAAPINGRNKLPQGYSADELARLVYATDAPTPAQRSAVRRAIARLFNDGQILREGERQNWYVKPGGHWRSNRADSWWADNPAPVRYTREMTDAERAERETFRSARMAEIAVLSKL